MKHIILTIFLLTSFSAHATKWFQGGKEVENGDKIYQQIVAYITEIGPAAAGREVEATLTPKMPRQVDEYTTENAVVFDETDLTLYFTTFVKGDIFTDPVIYMSAKQQMVTVIEYLIMSQVATQCYNPANRALMDSGITFNNTVLFSGIAADDPLITSVGSEACAALDEMIEAGDAEVSPVPKM